MAVPVGANKAQVLSIARERLAAGDAAGAEQLLRPLIEQSPEDHHVMEPLAQALLALNRNEEALKYAQFMVKRRRNRSPYYVILGDALKATGKVQEAQDAYIQALDLDPDNALAKRRLE